MGKTLFYILGTIITILALAIAWPIGVLILIIFIVLIANMNAKSKRPHDALATKIEQIASQFDIRYGTPEEKLEQLAAIAAKAQEPKKKP